MLTPAQIAVLATELDENSNDDRLEVIATDLGFNWRNLTKDIAPFRTRATVFIQHLLKQRPPRDADLLETLRTGGNKQLKAVVAKLTAPSYFPPDGDAHDAIVLGRTAFMARPDLRMRLREFTTDVNAFSTRMLVVKGTIPGGKSHTWEYLRHLAFAEGAAQPFRHRLKGKGEAYTPRRLFEDVFRLLDMDVSGLPSLADEPQLARLDALITTFKGKIVGLTRSYWLVIDDLNDPVVTPAIREAAFAMAQAVEELKSQSLWIALLGYNEPIVDPDLRFIAQDDAEYPTPELVAAHLQALSNASPNPLRDDRAAQIANTMFQGYGTLDKAAMIELTSKIELMGARLLLGQQP